MNQIKQVLLLHQKGVSNHLIARELGMSKRCKSVNDHLRYDI